MDSIIRDHWLDLWVCLKIIHIIIDINIVFVYLLPFVIFFFSCRYANPQDDLTHKIVMDTLVAGLFLRPPCGTEARIRIPVRTLPNLLLTKHLIHIFFFSFFFFCLSFTICLFHFCITFSLFNFILCCCFFVLSLLFLFFFFSSSITARMSGRALCLCGDAAHQTLLQVPPRHPLRSLPDVFVEQKERVLCNGMIQSKLKKTRKKKKISGQDRGRMKIELAILMAIPKFLLPANSTRTLPR